MIMATNTGEKYISFLNNRYFLKKTIDGVQKYFGSFKTLTEAKKHKEYCIQHNWSKGCMKRIHREYNDEYRYIQKVPGTTHYRICKNVNGVYKYFGTFETWDEAKAHRDYCEANNWSKECVYLRRQKHNLPQYITRQRDKGYLLQKTMSDGRQYRRYFSNLDSAIHERNLLLKCDWDEERLMELDESMGTL